VRAGATRRPPGGRRTRVLVCVAIILGTACAPPRALPLKGMPAPVRLPSGALPPGDQVVRFRWQYRDPSFSAKGDGAARVAPPDSARLDFVVGGALGGSGYALLFDDTLVAPGGGAARRYLPATPLVWATLGRLAVPPAPDTVVRVDGDTVRADIGPGVESNGTTWRVAYTGGQLVSLERLSGGRVRETVTRDLGHGRIRYENPGGRRSLTLTQVRSGPVPGFDPGVWHP
jgi:hypothetical protein